MTDVAGIYRDFSDKSSLISSLSLSQAREMVTSRNVDKGMFPKLEGCVTAIEGGVERAHVIDGMTPHSLLMEVFTDTGIGTMIAR